MEIAPAFRELLAQLSRGGQFGYWWLRSERQRNGKALYKHTVWWSAGEPAPLPDQTHTRHGPIHVYFGVLPTDARKGAHSRAEIDDVTALTCVFADFDAKDFASVTDCYNHVLNLDPTPSACIFSGGGYQALWLLDEPLLLTTPELRERAMGLLDAWVMYVGGDKAAKDLARVLRVPGTVNYKEKYGPSYPTADLVWYDPSLTYAIEELDAYAQAFTPDQLPATTSMFAEKSFTLTDDITRAAENLRRLSQGRRDDYNEWLAVGMALTPLGPTGLALWEDWSKLSDKYVEGDCDDRWRGFDLDPHGLAKLGAWANSDDPHSATTDRLSGVIRQIVRARIAYREDDGHEPEVSSESDAEAAPGEELPDLVLPHGYVLRDGALCIVRGENIKPFFYGLLWVEAIGTDVITGEMAYTVAWSCNGEVGSATVPKRALSTAQGLTERLGSFSLPIHPGNASAISTYLIELANSNAATIRRELVIDRYGYINSEMYDELMLLPAGTVGSARPITYTGRSPIKTGCDADAYPASIREVMTWDAPIAKLVLAISLSAPAIARLRPRRNPVLFLAGTSNIGKSSLVLWALGIWGPPHRKPFTVQAVGLTKAGAYQALAAQLGLPLCIDEAHRASDPDLLESIAYAYANTETRTIGTLDGKGKGGEDLYGALVLTGEAMPEFRNAGANNRQMYIDGNRDPSLPLGRGTRGKAGSPEAVLGAQRSKFLEQTVLDGAGLFGKVYADHLWANWSQFVTRVKAHQTLPKLHALATWAPTLAIAWESLLVACDLAGAAPPAPDLLDTWVEILQAGRLAADPAERTFDVLVSMLAAGVQDVRHNDPGWEILVLENEPIAYRKVVHGIAMGDWRIPTTSKPMMQRIDTRTLEQVGQTWVARGWVKPDPKTGKTTSVQRAGFPRSCLIVPPQVIDTWSATTGVVVTDTEDDAAED